MRTDRFFTVEWWNRNWKWVLPGCGCALVISVGVFVAVMLGFTTLMMRSSGGYQEALQRVASDCEARELLGVPIEAGWFVSGSASTSGPTGRSELSIPVHGPHGKGTIYLIANKRAGRWGFEVLELEPAAGARIDLLKSERKRCD